MNFSPFVRYGMGGADNLTAPPIQTQGIVAGAETEIMTKSQGLKLGNEKKISPLVIVLGLVALYAIFS